MRLNCYDIERIRKADHYYSINRSIAMKRIYLQDSWTCMHLGDDGEGMPVTIPDDAMPREKRSNQSMGGLNIGWFECFDYLYTRRLTLTAEEVALHHVLEFEGVYRDAEVYINGQKAGARPYGYTNFYVDCDAYFKPGENIIEVIAHNADQPKFPLVFRCGHVSTGGAVAQRKRAYRAEWCDHPYCVYHACKNQCVGEDQRRGPRECGNPGRQPRAGTDQRYTAQL